MKEKKLLEKQLKKMNEFEDEKERKETIRKSIEKLEERKDYKKINIARNFDLYYTKFDNMGKIVYAEIPLEIDKYKSNYLCDYLENIIYTAKFIITGVIKALGDDETVDTFCEELMFTDQYTPEEIKRNSLNK